MNAASDRKAVAVWKFPVPLRDRPGGCGVEMPARSEIVRVGQQDDQPMVWALVDPAEREMEVRRLLALPTGAVTDARVAYLGTTELHDGVIVVHIFEIVELS